MRIFGLTVTSTKEIEDLRTKATAGLQRIDSSRGWLSVIRESFTGAWQQNVEIRAENVLTHPTVFACITLIASDIAKMRLQLVRHIGDDVWEPVEAVENPAYAWPLSTPNRYQTFAKFIERWVFSKLIWGNAYVLLERDERQVVHAMYVLDPGRVTPMIAPDGAVYYELKRDQLVPIMEEPLVVPAREIIHDPMYTLYHDLVGLPPLHASGLAATLGLSIQNNSTNFFGNQSQPGGILVAPKGISQAQADEMRERWKAAFGGANRGEVAVLGGELSYHPIAETAANSQLIEQWEATSKAIASTFHVPWHLVGGPPPPYNNIQSLTVQYYTQCLQALTTQIEYSLDKGLGLKRPYGTMFDKDELLWMDTATMMSTIGEGIRAGVLAPNEARRMLNRGPVTGGEEPFIQQQNWPLRQMADRDVPGISEETVTPQASTDEVAETEKRLHAMRAATSRARTKGRALEMTYAA
jgi:HK97 family phage portal protein